MNQFNTINQDDPFNLNRFLTAQESIYQQVLAELKKVLVRYITKNARSQLRH